MADERAKRHIERWRALQAGRGVWLDHWEDLARVMLPRRMGFASTPVPGDKRSDDLYDGTPMQAARGLANAIGGMLRPDGQKWFFLKTVEDGDEASDEAKAWLADTEERLRDALGDPKARMRQATGEADLDLVVFGTAVIFEGEGANLNHLLFQSVHLKDACPYFDEQGAAVGMYRSRTLTVWQAMQKFGLAALSEATRQKIRDEKFTDTVEFIHCATPRGAGRADALVATQFPVADLWIELQDQRIVQEGGFREFPFIVPRWDTSSGEEYGRSPGMIGLPDANTLQAMGETMLIAGQRAADPPLAAPADGSFHEINTVPGGLAYYDPDTAAKIGRNPFFPLESGANMPLTREMQQDMRSQVFNAFLRNVFNLPAPGESPQMTATEVQARLQEFIRETGPVFGRLESDYTAPMVERAFKIMLRAGAFLPIPDVLAGRRVRFEYESPLKRIREQTEAVAAKAWVMDHIEAAKATGDMTILDTVNFDEFSRFTAAANGLPARVVNGRDVVARKRAQRQQAMEQQRQVEMASQAAAAAKTAGEIPGLRQALEGAGGGQAAA